MTQWEMKMFWHYFSWFASYVITFAVGYLVGAFDRKQETICDECGHPILRHGRNGCEVEWGDQWIDGCLVARGPCGCKEH